MSDLTSILFPEPPEDLELAVLSSLLCRTSDISDLEGVIEPEHFKDSINRKFFTTLRNRISERLPIENEDLVDILTIIGPMSQQEALDYIVKLLLIPAWGPASYYANLLFRDFKPS